MGSKLWAKLWYSTQRFPIAAHAQSSIPTWFTLPLMCAAESNDYVPELVLNSIWQGMERSLLEHPCWTLAGPAMNTVHCKLHSQCMVLHNIVTTSWMENVEYSLYYTITDIKYWYFL